MDSIQFEENVDTDIPQKIGVEYMVAYAKFVENKDSGSELSGVFFGGASTSLEKADELAKKCVNSARGGYILPKILELTEPHQVVGALYDVQEQFEKMQKQMAECHSTITRTNTRKKK